MLFTHEIYAESYLEKFAGLLISEPNDNSKPEGGDINYDPIASLLVSESTVNHETASEFSSDSRSSSYG